MKAKRNTRAGDKPNAFVTSGNVSVAMRSHQHTHCRFQNTLSP